jgi:hypothetical protein
LSKFFSSQCLPSHQAACTTAYQLRSELRSELRISFCDILDASNNSARFFSSKLGRGTKPNLQNKNIYGASQKKVGYASDKLAVID